MSGTILHEPGRQGLAGGLVPTLAVPSVLATENGQALRMTVYNSVDGALVELTGILLTDDGPIPLREEIRPTANRAANVCYSNLQRGSVKNVRAALTAGAVRRGQCFVVVEYLESRLPGAQVFQVLLSGYVTNATGISFPGSPIEAPQEGAGHVYSLREAAPALGAVMVVTVPVNARWHIRAGSVFFATAAAGAARTAEVHLSGPTLYIVPSDYQTLNANTLYRIDLATLGYGVAPLALPAIGGTIVKLNMAPNVVLTSLQTFGIQVWNINAGDGFGDFNFLVEEWIDF